MKETGVILYDGPSVLDGSPIVVIATLKSKNSKTGDVVQTWILRSDVNPLEASEKKQDYSICGGCPHRQSIGGGCYVNIGQAPNGVFKAYKRGMYAKVDDNRLAELMKKRKVRIGAYGDPAAVPYRVWERVTGFASGWLGYTHQQGHPKFDKRILDFCMLSVDTPKQAQKANARYFRVKTPESPMMENEIECLADSKGMTCLECGKCNGMAGEGPSIVINVHGTRSARYTNKFKGVNIAVAA